jgi:hypothetical protein
MEEKRSAEIYGAYSLLPSLVKFLTDYFMQDCKWNVMRFLVEQI